jgi:predicted TIM-barrel fold metal-dependent hydrolase
MRKRLFVLCLVVVAISSCRSKSAEYYSVADFEKVSKIDMHFHYNTSDVSYLKFADSLNFRIVSPNVDAGEMPIDRQLEIASAVRQKFPEKFAFFGTFAVDSFGRPGFAENAIAYMDKCMKAGACGIKIWKNIGMVLKNSASQYVMVDNEEFDPVFDYMEANKISLIAHLGEPRNCWLPENEMTVDNDRRYYTRHPEYYMYLHPEAPSYQDQINARDNLLRKHPKLSFTGAHLASLEWSVDELAERFDEFPEMKADLAARIGNIQHQSLADRERVRNFLIKYQDRIMYGTDITLSVKDTVYSRVTSGMRAIWMDHWAYLATDSSVVVKALGGKEVKGLQLPREVIDKIYRQNAEHFFSLNQ